MYASPLIRSSGRRSRWVALLLAMLIAVGSLSGLRAAPAPGAPRGGVEAIPAVNKASPILFHRRDTLTNSNEPMVEAQSSAEAPNGFVQKVLEASNRDGGGVEAQSLTDAPDGFQYGRGRLVSTTGG